MDLPNLGYVPPLQPHQIVPLNHLEHGNQKLFALIFAKSFLYSINYTIEIKHILLELKLP